MTTPTCPACKTTEFETINGGRHLRCCACRWLCIRQPDGSVATALPQATQFKPSKAKRQARQPFDHAKLDRILKGDQP